MRKSLIWLSLVVLAAIAPALADEIVYFTNGTSMVIETHEVDEATENLRVQLPGAGLMEFPLEQVSKIEDAQGVVTVPGQSNVVVRGKSTYRIEGTRPARHRREQWQPTLGSKAPDDDVTIDNGLLVSRPYGNGASATKRQLVVTGTRNLNQPITSRRARTGGNSRTGSRQVISSPNQNSTRRQPVAVRAKK